MNAVGDGRFWGAMRDMGTASVEEHKARREATTSASATPMGPAVVSAREISVRLLDRPLLLGRHHRDAGVQRAVNLGLIVGADAVAEAGEPLRQLGPKGEALADRHLGVNRPERGNVLTSHLLGDAPGLHQAGLKASALLGKRTNIVLAQRIAFCSIKKNHATTELIAR
jgi:hypothetical protein